MKGKKTGGRQPGSVNKATAARQALVAASGATPLDVMLDNMRFAHHRAAELINELIAKMKVDGGEVKDVVEGLKLVLQLRKQAQDCASDAANYVHPKLANIQHGQDPDNPLKSVTDADRLQVMLGVFTENPKLLDQLMKMLK